VGRSGLPGFVRIGGARSVFRRYVSDCAHGFGDTEFFRSVLWNFLHADMAHSLSGCDPDRIVYFDSRHVYEAALSSEIMSVSSEITKLALQHVGLLCSAHLDLIDQVVRFQWARVCETDEEAEMVDCEFQRAAIPGQPYGVLFEQLSDYRCDNLDNLQVSPLADFSMEANGPITKCIIRFDDSLDSVGTVEFSFSKHSLMIAPLRN
jgi:hypothetical protein